MGLLQALAFLAMTTAIGALALATAFGVWWLGRWVFGDTSAWAALTGVLAVFCGIFGMPLWAGAIGYARELMRRLRRRP